MTDTDQKQKRKQNELDDQEHNGDEQHLAEHPTGDERPMDQESVAADYDAVVAERDGYLDQLLRERADFANFRRRVDQERILARQLASRDILVQLLPVMDDFNRAMAAVPEDQASTGWVSGTAMVGKKLTNLLERAGVTPVEALGQRFDPAEHEAVASEPGTPGEYVAEVYQEGYLLGSTLLRPAMVKTGDVPADGATGSGSADENDESAERAVNRQ
ncbi:MAG: nucleotide exchange factor GrpE [Thermomicrobiales bacterium]